MKKLTCLLFCIAVLVAADKPQSERKDQRDSIPIPAGAVRIALPHVEQPDELSCGVAAMMSICNFYGVGPQRYESFKTELKTDKNGTSYRNMIALARKLDLEVKLEHAGTEPPMTLERLLAYLGQGKPVICSIQAYADNPKVYENANSNADGHYVVAVGFDETNLYFVDPSINWRKPDADPRRGFLPKEEFVKRWHDNEGTDDAPEIVRRLGIAIYPKGEGTAFMTQAKRIE